MRCELSESHDVWARGQGLEVESGGVARDEGLGVESQNVWARGEELEVQSGCVARGEWLVRGYG